MAGITIDDSVFEYDELKLFFREDYKINDWLTIHQPAIGDIMNYGEKEYFSMVTTLCANADSLKVMLWDVGKDWNKTSNFEIFVSLLPQIQSMDISPLFGDFDFSNFRVYLGEDKSVFMIDMENRREIDEFLYENIVRYIRKLHGMVYKPKKVKGKLAKEALIEKERYALQEQEKEGKEYHSQLKDMISSMLVYPGFKYKAYELKECGIYEFMDSVQRAQIIESSLALLKGAYSGFMDTKKIDKKQFNWLRSFND